MLISSKITISEMKKWADLEMIRENKIIEIYNYFGDLSWLLNQSN